MTQSLHTLSDRDLHELISAIRSGRLTAPATSMSIRRVITGATAANIATDIQSLFDAGFTTEHLAVALDLVRADRAARPVAGGHVDLVTTGPNDVGTGDRDTSVVVRDLFASATQSVLVAGYAVYQGQHVFQALADRMQELADLKVRLCLDIQRARTDTTASDDLIRRFAYRFKTTEWPAGRRLPEVYYDPRSLEIGSKHRTSLHAKCVVVDGQRVFVSSANFTEAAQFRNIEVGVVIDDGRIAERLTSFFAALIDANRLQLVEL